LASGGEDAVDDALADPPVSTDLLLEPWTPASGARHKAVTLPARPGETALIDEDRLGALSLFLLLADRIEIHDALAASDAWAGDALRYFRRGSELCSAVRIAAVDRAGAQRIEAALRAWDTAFAGGRVEVTREGDDTVAEACDPGETAAFEVPERAEASLLLLVGRLQVYVSGLEQGAPPERARCVAETFADEVRAEELDPEEPIPEARGREIGQLALAACR
jgi:hypothetical protein